MSDYQEPTPLTNQFYWDIDDAITLLGEAALYSRLQQKEQAKETLKTAIFSAQQALEKLEK